MKRYSELSKETIQKLKDLGELNGCGGKGGFVQPPNFFFLADCLHHDYKFYVGGGIKEYLKANWQFYVAMVKDVNRVSRETITPLSQITFIVFFLVATNYFIAVNIFGWKFFNWK